MIRSTCGICLCSIAWVVLMTGVGCWSPSASEVIVYTALDREFSEPILDDFTARTGVKVLAKYDVESTKTLQLVTAIEQEKNRPRCDVFWNNEILHTIRLQEQGLLDVYFPPPAESYPPQFRSAEGYWHGFAGRVRVLIVNTELVPADQRPDSIEDLIDPKWKDQVGIAKPAFGTTATHAAVLFAHWGDERAGQFFRAVKENARIMSGNKQVAASVGRGQLAFGLTDTDDAIIEKDNGMPVEIIYPDQEEGGLGALFIPNSLCVIKNSANAEHAHQLIDFLLSPEVESRLATGRSAQFPLNPSVTTPSRAAPAEPLRWMEVEFEGAAKKWDVSQVLIRKLFGSAD